MSVQAISWVLDHSRSTGNDRCVLIAIANRAGHRDDKGTEWCWPSLATIAREANVSHRTAQRAIRRLAESGELTIKEPSGERPDGAEWGRTDRLPHLYGIKTGRGDSVSPRDGDGVTTEAPRGDSVAAHGVTERAPRGDTRVTRTVREPKELQPKENPKSMRARDPDIIRDACQSLADHVAAYTDTDPPVVTREWMGTMLALTAEHGIPTVQAAIRWVFDVDPEGFWRGVVTSPKVLRRNWTKIAAAAARQRESGRVNGDWYRAAAAAVREAGG